MCTVCGCQKLLRFGFAKNVLIGLVLVFTKLTAVSGFSWFVFLHCVSFNVHELYFLSMVHHLSFTLLWYTLETTYFRSELWHEENTLTVDPITLSRWKMNCE